MGRGLGGRGESARIGRGSVLQEFGGQGHGHGQGEVTPPLKADKDSQGQTHGWVTLRLTLLGLELPSASLPGSPSCPRAGHQPGGEARIRSWSLEFTFLLCH